MKNPSYEILKTIYAALNGQVTINSVTVPVYTFAPTGVNRYIWLAALRGSEDWTKDEFGGNWFIDINCIDRVANGQENMKVVFDIADQVMQTLQPTPNAKLSLGDGITDHRLQLVNSRDLTELTEDGVEFRVLLEWRVMLSAGDNVIT